jgi:hypothetical protein
VITTFEKVSAYPKKTGKCLCGKRRSRSTHIYHTINPFNKNAKGEIKTYAEVRADVSKEVAKWMAEPIRCDDCPKEPTRG